VANGDIKGGAMPANKVVSQKVGKFSSSHHSFDEIWIQNCPSSFTSSFHITDCLHCLETPGLHLRCSSEQVHP
jgi:hypothetical protein